MASSTFLASYKFPLTEKPAVSPQEKNLYQDIFNLQNTLRSVIKEFTEDAPDDGKTYGRKDYQWVEVTGGGGGGGGGGQVNAIVAGIGIAVDSTDPANPVVSATSTVKLAPSLVLINQNGTFNNNYRGYTVATRISASNLLSQATTWSFSMYWQATGNVKFGSMRAALTLPGSTIVVNSAPARIGGQLTPTVSPTGGEIRVEVDPIALPITGNHDVWILVYVAADSPTSPNARQFEPVSYIDSGYLFGDQTNVTNLNVFPLINRFAISRARPIT